MKAQRRHELQDNSLAKVITNAPTFWQESGGKMLAVLVAVVVIIVLVRYRSYSNRQARAQATANLANARALIDQMPSLAVFSPLSSGQEVAVRAGQYYNDATGFISEAIRSTDDRKIQAEALLAKGDLNWALASLPPIPGAATQPSLQVRDPKDLTASAAEAYQTILNNYSDQKYAALAARFSLAAIAENRHDFDAAKTQYEKLALETKDWPSYQQVASARLNLLATLRNPPVLGKPTTLPVFDDIPTTLGAAGPSVPASVRAPSTAAASTAPTTRPSGT